MIIIYISGWVALATSVIGLFPQIYKAIQTRSTNDISMLMLINYLVCSIAWIVYGSLTDSSFVVYSNILGLSSSVLLIFLKRKYDADVTISIPTEENKIS